jgi:hypothetical protein
MFGTAAGCLQLTGTVCSWQELAAVDRNCLLLTGTGCCWQEQSAVDRNWLLLTGTVCCWHNAVWTSAQPNVSSSCSWQELSAVDTTHSPQSPQFLTVSFCLLIKCVLCLWNHERCFKTWLSTCCNAPTTLGECGCPTPVLGSHLPSSFCLLQKVVAENLVSP